MCSASLENGAVAKGSPKGTAIMEGTPAVGNMLMKTEGSQGETPPVLTPPAFQNTTAPRMGQPSQQPEPRSQYICLQRGSSPAQSRKVRKVWEEVTNRE